MIVSHTCFVALRTACSSPLGRVLADVLELLLHVAGELRADWMLCSHCATACSPVCGAPAPGSPPPVDGPQPAITRAPRERAHQQ
jgi:hypothetical protein